MMYEGTNFFFHTNRYYTYVSGRQIEMIQMKSVRFGLVRLVFSNFSTEQNYWTSQFEKIGNRCWLIEGENHSILVEDKSVLVRLIYQKYKRKTNKLKTGKHTHVLPQIEHQNNWANPLNRTIFCNPGQFYKSFSSVWFWIVKKLTSQFGFDLWGGKIEAKLNRIEPESN